MRLELPRLLRQSGATVLYVTQDYKEAMALADRIAVLADGRFVQTATPEDIYMQPATLGVARLFGDPSINTAETVIAADASGVHVALGGAQVPVAAAYAAHAGRAVTFGVRPEAVELGGSDGTRGGGHGRDAAQRARRAAAADRKRLGVPRLASRQPPRFRKRARRSARASPTAGTHIFDRQTGERLHG